MVTTATNVEKSVGKCRFLEKKFVSLHPVLDE